MIRILCCRPGWSRADSIGLYVESGPSRFLTRLADRAPMITAVGR